MVERELMKLISGDLSGSVRAIKNQQKKESDFLPSHLYAVCNFDISLLPIKFNLPMVYKPVDWVCARGIGHKPRHLSDLSGGYLSSITGEIYNRYRLLSSGDINNFYIEILNSYEDLCGVMNKLQHQAFQINSQFFKYLLENEKGYIHSASFNPGFLAFMNITKVSFKLRELYMKDEVIKKFCSFNEILNIVHKHIQRSRYENFILNLALAYDGYQFDLPAFLDFRGRIYRSGILHFHERDLARSLIIFADKKDEDIKFSVGNK